ncbi:uncharacterized protein [Cicer arietinum]|uniref:Uncharacterized protein LOC101502795 n=1 Tax=Cicer arietinum TaxID=3827 RepID=A0A1S2XHB6_CICAR|nr:uncharacterized protein LOC101502795 [Cicer arietinum]
MTETCSVSDTITTWITPSSIFLMVNLVIGTIAIITRFATHRKRQLDSSHKLVRSTSSFQLGCYKYEPSTITMPEETQIEPVQNNDSSRLNQVKSGLCLTQIDEEPVEPTPNPLVRAPSLLERLLSISFRRSESVKVEEEKKPESESEADTEEGVDAKADDFIKRFKQQLRLERLDSMLRYKDILHRR